MMRSRALLLVLAAVGVAACSSGGTDPGPAPTRVTISGGRPGIIPGQNLQLTATAYDGTGAVVADPGTFVWSSSSQSVATIDQTGKVSAVAAGQTTIKAALTSVSGTYTLTVEPGAAGWRGAVP